MTARTLYSVTGDIKDVNTLLVPRVPTQAMLDAFYDAPAADGSDESDWKKSYRAMLAAVTKEQTC